MITTLFTLAYALLSFIVIILLSMILDGGLRVGYLWLFGFFIVPPNLFFGIGMLWRTLLAKLYPSGMAYELIATLFLFSTLAPLTSYAILEARGLHENEVYGVPFYICGLVSLLPGVLTILIRIQGSDEGQRVSLKAALLGSVTLYLITVVVSGFYPRD